MRVMMFMKRYMRRDDRCLVVFDRFCNILCRLSLFLFFFFQAEDGIRDADVTGVQTCALPVIGLMCLRTFVADESRSDAELQQLETGARALGAAFQKVNFLRDLADDYQSLGRSYFPGVNVAEFTEAAKFNILDDIEADFRQSRAALHLLPTSSRRAVILAHSLFVELADRLYATPADRILTARISVPTSTKLRLAAAAYSGRMPRR